VQSAGLDEGVYIGAWLEVKAFEIRLRSSYRDLLPPDSASTQPVRLAISFHHFLNRESACSTQTRPSPAAIAMPRLCSRAVNRSSTRVADSTIRPVDVHRVARRAKRNARIRLDRRVMQVAAGTARRHGASCSSRRARAAMAKHVSRSSRGVTNPSIVRTASRPNGGQVARRAPPIASPGAVLRRRLS
jgi:hypothetical protein